MEKYSSQIYKSRDGRHLIHNLYRNYLMNVDVPVSERMIETRFGETHIVRYGDPEGKPMLTFYGNMAFNPLAIKPFTKFLNLHKMQLIVPDPPGQIGFSEEKLLLFSKDDYSSWAIELMNELELQTVSVLGYSFGGYPALQLCANAALRVERLLLIMPGGIIHVPQSRMTRITKQALNEKNTTNEVIKKSLQPILAFQENDLIESVKMIYLHTKLRKNDFSPIKKKHLQKFRSPVYVIAEKDDYFFPGENVLKRAKKIFPHLVESRILNTGCHCGLFKEGIENDLKETMESINNFLLENNC